MKSASEMLGIAEEGERNTEHIVDEAIVKVLDMFEPKMEDEAKQGKYNFIVSVDEVHNFLNAQGVRANWDKIVSGVVGELRLLGYYARFEYDKNDVQMINVGWFDPKESEK